LDQHFNSIKRKAFLGFINLIVLMGLFLFLPAWSLKFWQAWIYLFIFGTSSLLITFFLMKKDMELLQRRLSAGPGAEKEKSQKFIQAVAGIAFISILVVPGFDHRFGWSNVPLYLLITGDVFVATGFFIIFLVFKENSYTSGIIETAKGQAVVSTGPYAIIRHPMYSGALLMLLFTPIALGSFWGLLVFLPMLIAIIWRLLDEEKYLSKNLPGYTDYCQKTVYRLIPTIW
jgi:protein-S-isoprenylcysteine O-methyltransferase Ste14